MFDDYRNTEYCPCLSEVCSKKDKVVNLIKGNHKRARDMHTYISKNDAEYKLKFLEAYNGKCSYCGVSISIIPKEMFEIDHFIYEKSSEFGGSKANAGYIENLKLSCHTCNHKKSSFEFPVVEREAFDPDFDKIKEIYMRDENFYIRVAESYKDNTTAIAFHKQLKFGVEIRRLDFLLMNMIGLNRTLNDQSGITHELCKSIDFLRLKRNIMSSD